MKQWKILVFFTLLLLIPVQVSAKKTLKTCYYNNKYDGISKYRLEVTIKIYDDYSSEAIVTNFAGENMKNKESILNWDNYKDKFKKNKECIKYVSVVNGWFINGTKVWIENDKDKIKKPDGALVSALKEITQKEKEENKSEAEKQKEEEILKDLGEQLGILNEKEDYYKSVVEATNYLNKKVEEYKSGSCIDQSDNAYMTEYSDCRTLINNLEKTTDEFKKLLDNYIASGYVDENDNRVISLKEAIRNAKQVTGDAENFFRQNSEYINQRNEDVANGQETTVEKPDFYQQFTVVEESEKSKGCAIFGDNITKIIKDVYNLIKIGAPILVVVLGILDFVKALLAGDDKGFKEAWQRFIKRLVAAVVVILLPVLITFILDISGVLKQYGIEENGNEIYCIFK